MATLRVQRRRSGEPARLDQISGEQAFLSFPRAPAGLCTHGRGKCPGGGGGGAGKPPWGSAKQREVPSAPCSSPHGEGVGKPPVLFQLLENISVGRALLLPLNVLGNFTRDAVQTWSFLCGKVLSHAMDFSHSCMAILAVYFFLSELWACVSFQGFFCVLGAVELLGVKLFIMCSCDPFPKRLICHGSPLSSLILVISLNDMAQSRVRSPKPWHGVCLKFGQ